MTLYSYYYLIVYMKCFLLHCYVLPGLTVAGIVTNVTEALQISKSFSGENIYIEKYIEKTVLPIWRLFYTSNVTLLQIG